MCERESIASNQGEGGRVRDGGVFPSTGEGGGGRTAVPARPRR